MNPAPQAKAFRLQLQAEGTPSEAGKQLVREIMNGAADQLSVPEMTDLLAGMISGCAGYLAVVLGPDVARNVLRALPDATANAVTQVDSERVRH